VHRIAVEVAAGDIDRLGHVNNSVYLRWIEQAVHQHWQVHATPSEYDALDWIAVRHEIDYRKPAFDGERLAVETRLTSVRRARAWYSTAIHRGDDLLIEAVSCWCCIDSATGRLTLIPPEATARIMGTA